MHWICFLFAVVLHLITVVFDNKLCTRVCSVFYKVKAFGESVTETVSVCDRLFAEYFLCANGRS